MTKKQYITELRNIVKRAKKEVEILTKKSKFRVFENYPHYSVYSGKLIISENLELNATGIFLNAVDHYPMLPNLFPYTKEELDIIKKNDSEEKIKAYEESIRVHQETINRYKEQIKMIKDCKK